MSTAAASNSTILDDELLHGPVPAKALFDERSIWIAGFLGTVLAGGILMYYNARQLGRGDGIRHLGVAFALLVVVIAINVGVRVAFSDGIPSFIYVLVQLFALQAYYGVTQKDTVGKAVEAGGKLRSRWLAAGIGLLVSVAFIAVVLVVVFSSTAF